MASATPAPLERTLESGRAVLARTERWLRVAPGDAVAIELTGSDRPRRPSLERGEGPNGLARWRRRIARRRALVLLQRNLLIALALAVVIEVVIIFAGGRRLSLWLLAPLALVLVTEVAGLARRVSMRQTARMLDSGLGLANRVETALELTHTSPRPEGSEPTAGAPARLLAARVAAESDEALGRSFATAHVVTRRSRAEPGMLLVAALVLALLLALPGFGLGSAASRHTTSAAIHSRSARGAGGKVGAAKPRHPAHAAPLPVGAQTDEVHQPPLAIVPGQSNRTAGHLPGGDIYGHGAIDNQKELDREGLASADTSVKVVSAPNGSAGAAGSSGSGSSTHSPSNAGQSASSRSSSTSGGLSTPGSSSKSSTGPTRAGGKGGTTPGHSGGAAGSGGKSSAARTGAAPPGGESAGGVRGSTQLSAGLVPDLPTGAAGLPLQAGYAPSATKGSSSDSGVSQTPNGGGGAGRAAQTNQASSGAGTSITVIAPTPNATTSADQGLLNSYFGSADTLRFGSW